MWPTIFWPALVLLFLNQTACTLALSLLDPSDKPDSTCVFCFANGRPDQGETQIPLFSSVSTSSKSNNKESRSERTLQEALTHSEKKEWNTGFQKDNNGGIQRLNSQSSEEKTDGRSAKSIKASESGDSSERETQLTQVNGQPVVKTDSGKQSSFSNSGQVSNDTKFSSESSSSDDQVEKVVLPPPPRPIVDCFQRNRPSIIFLVPTSATADAFARMLSFLEIFLSRLRLRVLIVIFNRRVLKVLDYPPLEAEKLRGRLAEAARSLRGNLDDVCDLAVAAAEASQLRQRLRLPSPCWLVVMAPTTARLDILPPLELRRAAQDTRQSFDHLTCVVERGPPQALDSQTTDLLSNFASGGPSGLLPLDFGQGASVDASSADVLGRQLCEGADATSGRFEEPGGLRPIPLDEPSDRPFGRPSDEPSGRHFNRPFGRLSDSGAAGSRGCGSC